MLIDDVFRSFATGIRKKRVGTLKWSAARTTGQALYSCQLVRIAVQPENWLNYRNNSAFA